MKDCHPDRRDRRTPIAPARTALRRAFALLALVALGSSRAVALGDAPVVSPQGVARLATDAGIEVGLVQIAGIWRVSLVITPAEGTRGHFEYTTDFAQWTALPTVTHDGFTPYTFSTVLGDGFFARFVVD